MLLFDVPSRINEIFLWVMKKAKRPIEIDDIGPSMHRSGILFAKHAGTCRSSLLTRGIYQ